MFPPAIAPPCASFAQLLAPGRSQAHGRALSRKLCRTHPGIGSRCGRRANCSDQIRACGPLRRRLYCAPMRLQNLLLASLIACAFAAPCAYADEAPAQVQDAASGFTAYRGGIEQIVDRARDLIGIRYRRSGDKPQTGFDCSGFVAYVYREGLGLVLPHRSREISKEGTPVSRDELEPGDLVF